MTCPFWGFWSIVWTLPVSGHYINMYICMCVSARLPPAPSGDSVGSKGDCGCHDRGGHYCLFGWMSWYWTRWNCSNKWLLSIDMSVWSLSTFWHDYVAFSTTGCCYELLCYGRGIPFLLCKVDHYWVCYSCLWKISTMWIGTSANLCSEYVLWLHGTLSTSVVRAVRNSKWMARKATPSLSWQLDRCRSFDWLPCASLYSSFEHFLGFGCFAGLH